MNISFSNLQQNNVALFLKIVDEEINQKHRKSINFGPRKEKALGHFENFHAVLKGISELSKFFAKQTLVKTFSVENRRSFKPPDVAKDKELDFYYSETDYGTLSI